MSQWNYVDASSDVVARVLDSGVMESCLTKALPDGEVVLPFLPAPSDVEQEIVIAVQERLDDFARSRGYDNIVSLCTYATSSHQTFKVEGVCGVTARDSLWGACLQIKVDVQAGKRPMPTLEEVLAELPPLEWPKD